MLLIHSARGVRLNPGCCGISRVRFCASAEFHLSHPGQPSSSCRIRRGFPLPPLTTIKSTSSTRTVSSCHSAVPLPDAIVHSSSRSLRNFPSPAHFQRREAHTRRVEDRSPHFE